MAAPKQDTDLESQVKALQRDVEALVQRSGTRHYATADRPPAPGVKGMVIFNLTTLKHQGSNGVVWNDLY